MNEAIRYLRESGMLKTGGMFILLGSFAFSGIIIYKNLKDIKLTNLRIKEIEKNLNKED